MTGRIFITLAAALAISNAASAQVSIRAPFVRVETGGPAGTYVRAPFVNLFVPSYPPVFYGPPPFILLPPVVGQQPFPVNPGVAQLPAPRVAPQPLPPGPIIPNGEPPLNPDLAPPAPAEALKTTSLEEFAKAFKPRAGNYEITLANPINGRPEAVKFSRPGEPRRVRLVDNGIEFIYGLRQFVRIEFDQDGPIVISR